MNENAQASIVRHILAVALPKDGTAPEWIDLFPNVGDVRTRDGRRFQVDAARLAAAFAADGLDIPIDINHATDHAAQNGGDAPAVGWGVEMRQQGQALQLRVDWLEEGRSLLSAKKYRYVSPSIQAAEDGTVIRIMAAALVTAPALGQQRALASAQNKPQEKSMKTVALKLGLGEGASEAECLAAVSGLTAKVEAMVPKAVHDETLQQLTATSAELAGIKTAARTAKVDGIITAALTARKILPAEKEHYVSLCATDAGLASVEQLLAAKGAVLAASGLDDRKPPASGEQPDAVTLAAKAKDIQTQRLNAGIPTSFAEAMTLATTAV